MCQPDIGQNSRNVRRPLAGFFAAVPCVAPAVVATALTSEKHATERPPLYTSHHGRGQRNRLHSLLKVFIGCILRLKYIKLDLHHAIKYRTDRIKGVSEASRRVCKQLRQERRKKVVDNERRAS